MGKKNRSKSKPLSTIERAKKDLLKLAADLFNLCVYQPSQKEEWGHYIKIYNSVQDFEKRQKDVTELNEEDSAQPRSRSELIPLFQKWLAKNDVFYSGVEIKDFEELDQGFGLIASKDITMKENLATVPRAVMITSEKAKNSYLGDLINNNEILSLMPNVCLALFLHCEKYSTLSEYKPYIDILPNDFNTTLYFNPNEILHLKGSPNLSGTIQQYKSIVRQFAMIFQLFNGANHKMLVDKIPCKALDNFTFTAYRWAVSAVTTRQNKIPLESASSDECVTTDSTLALIPLWDLFNHDIGPMSTRYNIESHHLECLSMKSFKQGEQVTICYGSRPNSDLLIHNGFIQTNNPFDKVKISLGVSPKDPLYVKKAKLLKRLNIGVSGQFVICAMEGNLPTSPPIIAFLRIFHMDDGQLEEWLNRNTADLNMLREVYVSGSEFQNDAKIWEFLYNRVSLLLRGFGPEFKEASEVKLCDPELSFRAKLAIQLRKEEYRVLEACAHFCQDFKTSLLNKGGDKSDVRENSPEVKLIEENMER